MRYLGILLIFVSLPLLVSWLKGKSVSWQHAAFAVGFLPFGMGVLNLDAALISWAFWPGHTKGIILTILDTMALAILIATREKIGIPAFAALIGFYLFSTIASLAFSGSPMAGSFYAFQTVRILVFFLALTILLQDRRNWDWVCLGLASGAILQAGFALMQKAGGTVQAAGTMGHQNLLGMTLHFVTLPLFARILAGDRNKIVLLGFMSGVIAASLTASRATVGFLGMGLFLLTVFSLVRKSTPVKWKAVGIGTLAALVAVPLALSNLSNRFEVMGEEGYDERGAMERAANMIWEDNPMGIGANQYVVIANGRGYSASAGVAPTHGSRSANVHNIYLLHAAEMGWLGLFSFSLLVGVAIVRGLRHALRSKNDQTADMVLGATVAIITMAIHGFFEWIIMYATTQYLVAIALAMIAASIASERAAPEVQSDNPNRQTRFDPIVGQVLR